MLKNLAAVRDKIGGTVTARVTWGNPATTFEELDELVSADGHFDYPLLAVRRRRMYAGDSSSNARPCWYR